MKIEGSGALVAGGASGLGEATARRLLGGGARVTIADVNDERGQALADELGERASFVHADVRNEDEVSAAATQATEVEGGLRICICCAGTGWAQKLAGSRGPHDLLPFETIIGINLIGTFNVLRFAASAAAYEGQIGQVAYSASKGGVVGMTLPAARDLADKGIRVMTIAPGLFDTQLLAALPEEARESLGKTVPFPHRLGQPDEFAQLACDIVENEMLNGEVIRLDGALRMAPR